MSRQRHQNARKMSGNKEDDKANYLDALSPKGLVNETARENIRKFADQYARHLQDQQILPPNLRNNVRKPTQEDLPDKLAKRTHLLSYIGHVHYDAATSKRRVEYLEGEWAEAKQELARTKDKMESEREGRYGMKRALQAAAIRMAVDGPDALLDLADAGGNCHEVIAVYHHALAGNPNLTSRDGVVEAVAKKVDEL